MFCENCGKKSKDGEVFCTSCGKSLISQPQPEKATAPQPTYNGKVKRLTVGWKIVIVVGALFIILAIIGVVDPGDNSNTPTSDNTTNQQTSGSQVALPTVSPQIPNGEPDSGNQQSAPAENSAPAVTTNNTVFSADDVAPYLTAVGQVECFQGDTLNDTGSGSVWEFSDSSQVYILTNEHVIKDDDSCTFLILSTPTDPTQGYYDLDISSAKDWNADTDAALIPITGVDESWASSTPTSELNYSIASLPVCQPSMPQESPVAVLGFPASTQDPGPTLTVTNGVISGYDGSNPDKYNDYYVSAQVDNGNSGGIALSKNDDGSICVLGIPTWISVGEQQVEGEVQDINNIFYMGDTQSSQ